MKEAEASSKELVLVYEGMKELLEQDSQRGVCVFLRCLWAQGKRKDAMSVVNKWKGEYMNRSALQLEEIIGAIMRENNRGKEELVFWKEVTEKREK